MTCSSGVLPRVQVEDELRVVYEAARQKNARCRSRSRSRGTRSSQRRVPAALVVQVTELDGARPSRRRSAASTISRVASTPAVARPPGSRSPNRRRRTRGRAPRRRAERGPSPATTRARCSKYVRASAYCTRPARGLAAVLVLLAHSAVSRSGCLRTNPHPRRCQSVCRRGTPVDHRRVGVPTTARDVPPLPAGLRGAVAEVDVLAVEAEAASKPPSSSSISRRRRRKAPSSQSPGRAPRALVEVVVARWRSSGGNEAAQRRPADERPRTVGKLRRDGCQRPSGQSNCGPAMPPLGCSSAKATRAATASGSATASGFATST